MLLITPRSGSDHEADLDIRLLRLVSFSYSSSISSHSIITPRIASLHRFVILSNPIPTTSVDQMLLAHHTLSKTTRATCRSHCFHSGPTHHSLSLAFL